MSADAGSDLHRTRLSLHLVALAALPAALTIVLPEWLLPLPGRIDPWIYQGFFRHPELYASTLFPDTYYGTRLGWIVPGYVSYALFKPETANAVLHLTFYSVSVVCVYAIVAAAAHRSAALLTAVMFGLCLPVIRGLGSDYVAAAVMAYSLLAAALLIRASRTSAAWPGLAAGMATGALFHSNMATVLLWPFVLAWIVPLSLARPAWRRTMVILLHWCLGGIVCTCALALFSVTHGGEWAFFLPNFSWIAGADPSVWDVTGFAWIPSSPAVFLPIAVGLSALAVPVVSWRRTPPGPMQIRAYAGFVVPFLGFVVFDYAGPGSLLAQAYYVAWLYPPAFVLLGAVLVGSAPEQRVQHALLPFVAGAMLVSIAAPSWFTVSGNPMLALAAAGALAMLAAAARSSGVRTLALTGVLLCVHGELPGYGPQTRHADLFPVVDRGAQFIARFRMSAAPGLLLATDDARRPYAEGVSAVYLWNYSLVSNDFARLTADEASRVMPGMIVVIIADDPARGSTFNDVFSAYGIEGHVLGSERVETAEGPLYFTALRANTLSRAAAVRPPVDTQHTRAGR